VSPAKKAKAQVKSTFLKIRVTQERLQRWKDAAERAKSIEDNDDLDFSAWVRRALNREMDQGNGGKKS
jgi:hypothetical protein